MRAVSRLVEITFTTPWSETLLWLITLHFTFLKRDIRAYDFYLKQLVQDTLSDICSYEKKVHIPL